MTRTIFECKICGGIYLHPFLGSWNGGDPNYSKCPFCGAYIQTFPPKRIHQKWVSEGFKGWWIFKKEIGHWENA